MAFPAYAIPTPTITDDFMSYPAPSRVGVDVGTSAWDVNPGATNGMDCESNVFGFAALVPDGTYTHAINGGFSCAARKEAIGIHHWALAQCIVPLDDAPGVFPAVRVNPSTGDCYYLWNMGYTDASGMFLGLNCRKGGVDHGLAVYDVNPGGTNDQYIDGLYYSDGFTALLEVIGTSPVQLRVSVIGSARHDPASYPGSTITRITHFPDDVPLGTSGNPACRVLGTFDDSVYRVTAGKPGLAGSGGISAEGGAFNFNAGEIVIPPVVVDGSPMSGTGSIAGSDWLVSQGIPLLESSVNKWRPFRLRSNGSLVYLRRS